MCIYIRKNDFNWERYQAGVFILYLRYPPMKFVLICIILSFLNRIHGQEDDIELIAGHVVSQKISRVYISIIGESFQVFRHGDRTPITTFPTDPVKPSDWPNGYFTFSIKYRVFFISN